MLLYQLFLQILDMAVTACPVIIIVLLARGIMYRLPKKYRYIIWLVVLVRLTCPVAVSSPVSLFNIIDPVSTYVINIETGIRKADSQPGYKTDGSNIQGNSMDNKVPGDIPGISHNNYSNKDIAVQQENPGGNISVPDSIQVADKQKKQAGIVIRYGAFIWLAGIVFILSWNFYMLSFMKKHLRNAVRFKDNIYECENIPSPFVTGILCPRIYIPFRLGEEEQEYILKHEKYHIKRKDYIIKPVAFLLACVYWFSPLVWLSYFLMVRDMEMSCDEYVLQNMGAGIRKNYSLSLLGFATNHRGTTAGFLSFGETDTRKRVVNVLNFKKPGKWIGILAVILILAVVAVCLTNARSTNKTNNINKTAGEDTKEHGDIIADEKINGYNVQIVHIADKEPPDKNAPESGTYYSGEFVIRTYKDNTEYAEYKLEFGDMAIYYPKEGISLTVKDYNGDGNKNDFAIGQGQTAIPGCGNFMYYQFFTIDENGGIGRYSLSTEDGKNLVTLPGEYSPAFESKNNEITYQALTEDGIKKQHINIVLAIPVNDVKASGQPMKDLLAAIENIMPEPVVDELHEKGYWRLSNGDGNYLLGNAENSEDITLRLDFSFSGNKLVQYVSKRYGFVNDMPDDRIDKRKAKELVAEFERAFLGMKSDINNIKEYDGYIAYKDKNHAAFIDGYENTFLVQLSKNMVINYEASKKWIKSGQETQKLQDNNFYFENMNVTIGFPENKTWIQNPQASYGKNTGVVTFYDNIAKTDVKLYFSKKPKKELENNENTVTYEDKYWSYFAGNQEKLIKIQSCKRKNMTTILLSWEYNKVYFYMYADFADAGNKERNNIEWQSLAKTASYVAENWYKVLSEKQ